MKAQPQGAWISVDGSHRPESFAFHDMDQLREALAQKRRLVGPYPDTICPHGCAECYGSRSPFVLKPSPPVTGLPTHLAAELFYTQTTPEAINKSTTSDCSWLTPRRKVLKGIARAQAVRKDPSVSPQVVTTPM